MPATISSIIQTASEPINDTSSDLGFAELQDKAPQLGGQHMGILRHPNSLLDRRQFLALSGASLATLAIGTEYRQLYATAQTEQTPNPVIGQFTPYVIETMAVNLFNRIGLNNYADLIDNPSILDQLKLLTINHSSDDSAFLQECQKLGLLSNPSLANQVLQLLNMQQIPSINDPQASITIARLLRSVLDLNYQPELMVAPEVTRLGFSPTHKIDAIFKRVLITPLQRWGFDNQGKPVLTEPKLRISYPAIIVDCLADHHYDQHFFSDLLHRAEPFIGNYHWDKKSGKFYVVDNNDQKHVIYRLPYAQLRMP